MRYRYRNENEMKDSGIEWLGNIPKSWVIKRNRFIFLDRRRDINEDESTPVLSLTTKGVKVKKDLSFGKSTESYIGHQLVYPGDIVFTPRDFDQTPILSGVSEHFGCISNLYFVLKCKENVNNKFVDYFWWGLKYKVDYFKNFSYGIRYSYNFEQFKDLLFINPDFIEQCKISKFLDQKTAQFDSIISKKEELIQKLEEAKKSFISEVVTGKVKVVKTSDGYELVERKKEEMKDSGVEWLGDIPKSWNTTKLKFKTSQINRGKSPEYVEESNIKVINQACIYWDKFKLQNVKYQDDNIKGDRGKLYKGDILVNSTGTGTLGRANIFNEEGDFIVDSHVTIIRCFDVEYAKYLRSVLRTDLFQGLIYSTMVTGSTNQIELSREGLRNMTILDLNTEELTLINDLLKLRINDINNTIMKTYMQIDKIKEAKQSLISEAVTGNIEILD